MKKIVSAVYPGSFDPLTNGHLDIIVRASSLFPQVIVALTQNINKKHFFPLSERLNLTKEAVRKLKNVKVISFDGLLSSFLERIDSFVLIRGLRAVSDFEYEFQMALMNRNLNKKIETVFLMTSQSNAFLSSSIVKEIALLNGKTEQFVPKCVEKSLKEKARNIRNENF